MRRRAAGHHVYSHFIYNNWRPRQRMRDCFLFHDSNSENDEFSYLCASLILTVEGEISNTNLFAIELKGSRVYNVKNFRSQKFESVALVLIYFWLSLSIGLRRIIPRQPAACI